MLRNGDKRSLPQKPSSISYERVNFCSRFGRAQPGSTSGQIGKVTQPSGCAERLTAGNGTVCAIRWGEVSNEPAREDARPTKKCPCLLVGDFDIIDDHFTIGTGRVASTGVGLRVATCLEVAPGGAHGIGV